MSERIIRELMFLLQFLAVGAAITFSYDILRIFRRVIRHDNFFLSLEDLLFWTGCAVGIFCLLYKENNGTVRWFAIMGAMLGMLLYRAAIGRLFVRYATKALNRLKKLFSPLRRLCRFLKKKLTACFKVFRIFLCKR